MFIVSGKNLIIPNEMRETQPAPLYNVKHLKLKIHKPLMSCAIEELEDSLLWDFFPSRDTVNRIRYRHQNFRGIICFCSTCISRYHIRFFRAVAIKGML